MASLKAYSQQHVRYFWALVLESLRTCHQQRFVWQPMRSIHILCFRAYLVALHGSATNTNVSGSPRVQAYIYIYVCMYVCMLEKQ